MNGKLVFIALVILLSGCQSMQPVTKQYVADGEGISCDQLAEWSPQINGFQVNQQHVFCGQKKPQKAVGFHSQPAGHHPSTYISSVADGGPNGKGIYKLKDIHLTFSGSARIKRFSTMFPDNCTKQQVLVSIVYAWQHRTGACQHNGLNWAQCGPNAPQGGGAEYCLANDGHPFEIAMAILEAHQLNTGFPIY